MKIFYSLSFRLVLLTVVIAVLALFTYLLGSTPREVALLTVFGAAILFGALLVVRFSDKRARESIAALEEARAEGEYFRHQVSETVKFQQAVDSATDGVIMTDADLKVAYLNPAMERMAGYVISDTLGKNVFEKFLNTDADATVLSELRDTIERGDEFTTEAFSFARKDGEVFNVQLSIYPLEREGEIRFYVALVQDITKRKEVDRAKTEFVSLASHQLRTPISAINWYAEMLLAGDLGRITKAQRSYLEEIYRGNQRMVELVNALLNVSRIELGTFVVVPEPTNIIEIVKTVLKELSPRIKTRKQTVREAYAPDFPNISLDPRLMRIVVDNLLSNAVKYTPEEGTISLSINVVENDSFVLAVQDSGYGIPKDEQDKIFSKLYRAENVKEKDTEGTGLGLYITKAIIEHSGGKIWFDSQEDEGTTFSVQLPLSGMVAQEGDKPLEETPSQ